MTAERRTLRRIIALGVTFIVLALAPPVGIMMAGAIVALSVARRQARLLALMIPLTAVAGALGPAPNGALVLPVGALALGIPIGLGVLAGRSYWRIVTVAAACIFVVNVAALAGMSALAAELADELASLGNDVEQFSEAQRQALALQEWMLRHWSEILTGVAFVEALVTALAVTAFVALWLRRTDSGLKVAGSFREMRVPDWGVWLVIVAFACWYADRQWSIEILRYASWNLGAALFAVYWLNGLSIVMYAVAVFRPSPFMVAALALAAVLLNLVVMLPIPGLFDTWGEFRRRMDAAIAARRLREESGDDSMR